MKLSNQEIIEQIRKKSEWVTAKELADIFDVSTRTIRTRIAGINQNERIIHSSYKGYHYTRQIKEVYYEDNERENQILFILRKLIVYDAKLNIYDLADELYISDSQFSRLLEDVRNHLEPFDLDLIRYRNFISLERKENNIRRLIMSLIRNQKNAFLIDDKFDSLIRIDDLNKIKEYTQAVLEDYDIYVNDYGFQNILIHIVIMMNRHSNSVFINEAMSLPTENTKFIFVSKKIKAFIQSNLNIELSDLDVGSLSLMICNNCNDIESNTINNNNMNAYIEEKYNALTNQILDKLADHYCLDIFDRKFIINLTIHIKNLIIRAKNHAFTPNPLTARFKEQNALIYDMAAFVANEIVKHEKINIIDDEITFIAFHIGYYIESLFDDCHKINTCFVYADYRMMHVRAVEKILNQLHSKLNISAIISIRNMNQIPDDIELIISSCGTVNKDAIPVVETSIFISDADINSIRAITNELIQQKTNKNSINGLKYFITNSLLKREYYAENEIEMIQKMSKDCFNLHLVDSTFVQEVLDRESLSSTSFSNNVAIPHSLEANARRSFLYVIINKKPMKWGDNEVNIIILLGASKADKLFFKDVFNSIINVLYEKENVHHLLKCSDWDSFISILSDLIIHYHE